MATALMLHPTRSQRQWRDPAQVEAELRQRFVALPDPHNDTGWLVDLRDPFHPVVSRHQTWAAAQAAVDEIILSLLCTSAA